MNTNRKGERQGGTNNNMCSARASADTVINKSAVCVQSGLKYNSLIDRTGCKQANESKQSYLLE